MNKYTTSMNQTISTLQEIGKGGEGSVYEIQDIYDSVAKIYHPSQRTYERQQKLHAMIANPPQDGTRKLTPPHISIAWPTELLFEQGQFAGYIMPRINKSPDIFHIFNPKLRTKAYKSFNWKYLHRTARNFAIALNALHERDYIMGDINQKNIMVADTAMVTLVDTDSFQVKDLQGNIHRCTVGVDEYTPPELQGMRMDSVERTKVHDYFGLGVIIFQLLMEGWHPFTGAPKNPNLSVGQTYTYNIKHGIFPYQPNQLFNPPFGAPDFNILHPEVQKLLIRCFVDGYKNPFARPSSHDCLEVLGIAEGALVQCLKNSDHLYSNHLDKCFWCEREERRQANVPNQLGLPPAERKQQTTHQTFQSPPKYTTPPKPQPQIQGVSYSPPITQPPKTITRKSPIIAVILSAIFLGGGGHIYLGQTLKGIALILINLCSMSIGLNVILYIPILVDAWKIAKKINQGYVVGDWEFGVSKNFLIIWGIIIGLIICGILAGNMF